MTKISTVTLALGVSKRDSQLSGKLLIESKDKVMQSYVSNKIAMKILALLKDELTTFGESNERR